MFKILVQALEILVFLFLIWRVLRLDSFRLDAISRLDNTEARITDLYRRHDMSPVLLGQQVCSDCGERLPENTAKTHDGHWLCSNCKVKPEADF